MKFSEFLMRPVPFSECNAGVKQFHYKSDGSNSLTHAVNIGRNDDQTHLDEILQSIDVAMRQQGMDRSTSVHTSQNILQLGEASSMVVDASAVPEGLDLSA